MSRFAVFGDPIAHSRSPLMHAAAFTALGLSHTYERRRVPAEGLSSALADLRDQGFRGVNLTVPLKVRALALVDRVTPLAARIGAINTVDVEPSGELVGRNTDAPGFVRGLGAVGATVRRAVVLGGGGAARAIVGGLLDETSAEVSWVTRDPDGLSARASVDSRVSIVGWPAWSKATTPIDLLVNATTVGMSGAAATRFPCAPGLDRVSDGGTVVDIVIPRPRGGLLDAAEARGLHVIDWRPMLVWQGVLALEGWLERPLPDHAVTAMFDALGEDPSGRLHVGKGAK